MTKPRRYFIVILIFSLTFALVLTSCRDADNAASGGGTGYWGDELPDEPSYTPDMPEYHCKEGGSYFVRKQYDLAIDAYKKALELDSRYSNGYYGLAMTYRALGELDLALENYSEVIRLQPDYAQPYEIRAEIYQRMGRFEEAEKDLDSFVRLYGQYPVPYLARGDFFMDMQDYERAADDYKVAVDKNHELKDAWLKYAEALRLSGKPEEAAVAADRSAELDGES